MWFWKVIIFSLELHFEMSLLVVPKFQTSYEAIAWSWEYFFFLSFSFCRKYYMSLKEAMMSVF